MAFDSVELTYPRLTELRKGSFAGSSNDLSGPSSTEKPFDQNFNWTSFWKDKTIKIKLFYFRA